jgi:hypothetical protein
MSPTGPDNNGNARPAGYILAKMGRYLTGESSTPKKKESEGEESGEKLVEKKDKKE